jgi:hypothetical protein
MSIIPETIPFKDQQLKYRKERIEDLTKDVRRKSQKLDTVIDLYSDNIKYMKLMQECIEELLKAEYGEDLDNEKAKNIVKLNREYIARQISWLENNFNKKK